MNIKPWREVAHPHKDVLEGTFQQSEFAADISQVHSGTATPEYLDPEKFYARTYITEGMRLLLTSVAQRLAGRGGDPVIQLQTAFGGGKTHTLLAVYHLASRRCATSQLAGVPALLDAAGIASLPEARVAVIDGIKLSPSQPRSHGPITAKTLWGELAVQLLGQDGYALVAQSDQDGTSPGKEVLTTLLQRAAPCVVLVDELVAYVRQFEAGKQYAGGTYDSNLTFVQALTEALKSVPNAILLASLPESEVEIGSAQGQRALAALEKYFGRVELVWKPVAAEEAFEIVRRRLFDRTGDMAAVEATARAFGDLYRANPTRFPGEAQAARYEERIVSAYPIHPEVFDRLYEDWSTLDKFQRTRGVLQYMAIVIHRLWNNGDRDALIMPGSLPLDDATVRNKSIHYLPTGWEPVIEREIDGPRSTAADIDGHDTRFGSVQAARRCARAIFLGSAPSNAAQNVRGIRMEGILLGAVQPGQAVGTFEDAVKRLRDKLHYLYGEAEAFWFDTRPNLRREMESRKANLKDADDVMPLLRERVMRVFAHNHRFAGIHVFSAAADIPDEYGTGPRLVVLAPGAVYLRNEDRLAVTAATEILEKRGEAPRLKRNRLIFLAPDGDTVDRLRDGARTYLAWKSIVDDVGQKRMDLGTYQAEQARRAMDGALDALGQLIRETWRWLLAPAEEMERGRLTLRWEAVGVSPSATNLVEAIEQKLKEEEWVIYRWSPVHLQRVLSQWYFKDGVAHVAALKFWQDCCSYPYLPRLVDATVLEEAIAAGLANRDAFAFANAAEDDEYRGFTYGRNTTVILDQDAVLIEHMAAERYQAQLDATRATQEPPAGLPPAPVGGPPRPTGVTGTAPTNATGAPPPMPLSGNSGDAALPTRFYASVEIDPDMATMRFSDVVAEVVQHLTSKVGVRVRITVDIEANATDGFDTATQRTVKENCASLGFSGRPEFD